VYGWNESRTETTTGINTRAVRLLTFACGLGKKKQVFERKLGSVFYTKKSLRTIVLETMIVGRSIIINLRTAWRGGGPPISTRQHPHWYRDRCGRNRGKKNGKFFRKTIVKQRFFRSPPPLPTTRHDTTPVITNATNSPRHDYGSYEFGFGRGQQQQQHQKKQKRKHVVVKYIRRSESKN